MTKDHFISFLAWVTTDRIQLVKLYPEGEAQTRMQLRGMGRLSLGCNRHGLMVCRMSLRGPRTGLPRNNGRRIFMFQGKVVVITGGCHGIGLCMAREFEKNGASVCVIDISQDAWFPGDIGDRDTLEAFARRVIGEYGRIDCLINNAPPLSKGIGSCTYEEFSQALAVGVTAPFYLAKLFAPYFQPGASILNISSSRDRMSQPQTESYTAAKGGISALTHALAVSLAGKVRVNSISPGWIDTDYTGYRGPDARQQPVGRVGDPMDIANMALFLCSDKAGFITGENICIDGGQTRLMIYHNDHGWHLQEEGEAPSA